MRTALYGALRAHHLPRRGNHVGAGRGRAGAVAAAEAGGRTAYSVRRHLGVVVLGARKGHNGPWQSRPLRGCSGSRREVGRQYLNKAVELSGLP